MKEKGEEDGESPILGLADRKSKWKAAIPIHRKGEEEYAIMRLEEELSK